MRSDFGLMPCVRPMIRRTHSFLSNIPGQQLLLAMGNQTTKKDKNMSLFDIYRENFPRSNRSVLPGLQ